MHTFSSFWPAYFAVLLVSAGYFIYVVRALLTVPKADTRGSRNGQMSGLVDPFLKLVCSAVVAGVATILLLIAAVLG
jgi:hypothetical protein